MNEQKQAEKPRLPISLSAFRRMRITLAEALKRGFIPERQTPIRHEPARLSPKQAKKARQRERREAARQPGPLSEKQAEHNRRYLQKHRARQLRARGVRA